MRYEKKQIGEVSESNLVNDPELTIKFQEEATRVANNLRLRYYQVFDVMEVEDVVGECWKKVLSQDISYDSKRGAKFETFVYMIVVAKLIDLTRSLNTARRIPVLWSLDVGADNDHSDEDANTSRYDLIPDNKYEDDIRALELVNDIKSYTSIFNMMPELNKIVSLFIEGYTSKEVSGITGVKEAQVRKVIKTLKIIIQHKCNGSEKSLGDILYYESQSWVDNDLNDTKRKDFVLSISSLIRDTQTKIELSDIVKGVLKGWSYKRIGESLNTDSITIQQTLMRYESIMI